MHADQLQGIGLDALLGTQFDDGLAFGRRIGHRREDAQPDKLPGTEPVDRIEARGLAVTDGDRTGLVEQQCVDVAGSLDGLARLGDDVGAERTIHTGDADGRKQAADGGRDQADEQRDERRDGDVGADVIGKGLERRADDDEHDRKACQQDGQGDFVGRLLARGAFHEGDHLVEETFARTRRNLHQDAVGKHFGTARDGTFVAARLADHRGGLARDGALVDRSEPLDNLAVGGDRVTGDAFEEVTLPEVGTAHDMRLSVGVDPLGRGFLTGLAQRVGLRLAARLGNGLGEVGEEHRGEKHQEDHDV